MGFEITVERQQLIAVLEANKAEHKALFDIAIVKYQERVIEWLTEKLDLAKQGKKIDHYINLPQPEEHVIDYDRVIGMLVMHTGETIVIPELLYRQYVDNEWGWSAAFASNTASYSQPVG